MGMVGLKKFWPGKRFGSKMFGPKILAYLHTFILISGNPTKTQNIFINCLTELDDFKKISLSFFLNFLGSKKFFDSKKFLGQKGY